MRGMSLTESSMGTTTGLRYMSSVGCRKAVNAGLETLLGLATDGMSGVQFIYTGKKKNIDSMRSRMQKEVQRLKSDKGIGAEIRNKCSINLKPLTDTVAKMALSASSASMAVTANDVNQRENAARVFLNGVLEYMDELYPILDKATEGKSPSIKEVEIEEVSVSAEEE